MKCYKEGDIKMSLTVELKRVKASDVADNKDANRSFVYIHTAWYERIVKEVSDE